MRKHLNKMAVVSILALSCAGVGLHAAGSGGGGGGSAPSQSSPRYDPVAEYQKGLAAFEAKDFKAAVRAFRRSLSVVEENAAGQYLLGASYIGLENHKRAIRPLKKAIKYNENMVQAHRDLAISYHKIGKPEKAQAALAVMETKCGANCAADSALGVAIGEVKAVMAGGRASIPRASGFQFASAQNGDGYYVRATALINQGEYESALAELNQAAKNFGPHPDILTYQGFANRKLKKYDLAEQYYQRALAVAPNHLGAIEYYGELKVERGDMKGAKQHLAQLDRLCSFGCVEAEELRRWIKSAHTS